MSVQYLAQKRHRLRKLRGETAYVDATAACLHVATLLGAGWSLRSVAGICGVPATTLSRFNRGAQTKASPQTIAAVLKVDPSAIAERTNSPSAEPFVPRVGTTRRLQALLYLGWGHQQMREHCGLNTAALLHQKGRWVTRSTHDAVASMYRELSSRRGPSTKANAWATMRGYRGPLAWDDIDRDPEPDIVEGLTPFHGIDEAVVLRLVDGDRSVEATIDERREAVRQLHARGLHTSAIARTIGRRVDNDLSFLGLTPNPDPERSGLSEQFTARGQSRRSAQRSAS